MDNLLTTFTSTFEQYWQILWWYMTNWSWYNPIPWLIFWCVMCFVLELLLPRQLDYKVVGRKGFWLDLFYVVFNDFLVMGLGFFAFMAVFEQVYLFGLQSIGIASPVLIDSSGWAWWLKVLVMFLVVDLMEFLAHYAMHRSNFLWAFHKIHHAQEEIGFASSRHFHWGEIFVFKTFIYIPISLLGFKAQEYTLVVLTLVYFAAFFSHTNVRLNFGFLNYLFITPQTHLWHHAKNMPHGHRYGVNFASVLPLWDLLIGTFYLPKNKKEVPELGVDDSHEMPKNFLGQMTYPFTFWFKGKAQDNVFDSAVRVETAKTSVTSSTPTKTKSSGKKKSKAVKKKRKS